MDDSWRGGRQVETGCMEPWWSKQIGNSIIGLPWTQAVQMMEEKYQDIKMGPCGNRSSSEPDTAGFSASAGAYFIGEACKKTKKCWFLSGSSTGQFFDSLHKASRSHHRSNLSEAVSEISTLTFCNNNKKGNPPAVPKSFSEVGSPSLHSLLWWDVRAIAKTRANTQCLGNKLHFQLKTGRRFSKGQKVSVWTP